MCFYQLQSDTSTHSILRWLHLKWLENKCVRSCRIGPFCKKEEVGTRKQMSSEMFPTTVDFHLHLVGWQVLLSNPELFYSKFAQRLY